VGVALLLFLPAHVAAQAAITDANIGTAATVWLTDPVTATTTYGPIADWNTAAVTSMVSLFYPSYTARPTFNDDISKWNTASVSTMTSVCCLPPDARALIAHVALRASSRCGLSIAAVRLVCHGSRKGCGVLAAALPSKGVQHKHRRLEHGERFVDVLCMLLAIAFACGPFFRSRR
jgi:hypothetical protein